MTTREALREEILQERKRREAFAEADLIGLIRRGAGQEALENLLFFATPSAFISAAGRLRGEIESGFGTAEEGLQRHYLRFLADLALGLRSFLPRWNLLSAERHGAAVLTAAQVAAEAEQVEGLVAELAAQAPGVAAGLLAEWQADSEARFRAEHAADPAGEAAALVGASINDYITNVSAAVAGSHLRRIAEMRAAGQTLTELSNDYGSFLQYALYIGASFVTCNPPLVDAAWATDHPEYWTPIVDDIIAAHPEADDDELARWMTMEVVLSNMRLLRPIFLLTEGRMGCVCLQVNPHKHGDAATMISDALAIYERMRHRLEGGVPNVVFKLPGTKGGLAACRALTGRGIGVTITVNFGMFEHLPFAEAIQAGQSLFSNLVEMNGRLAYPVRDELLGKLEELAAHGIDEAQAREAAAWSGVAVIKRVYQLLKEKGYDLRQAKPLVASLRIYEGEAYEGLPSAFPDMTEILGASILSVFPNVRRAFDAQPEMTLEPLRIEAPVPEEILERLTHSEIFKQAYYVADREWVAEEEERFRPDYELTLEDEAGTAAWAPVYNTLTGFCDAYDTFVERIRGRQQLS
jgi:transaldolase